MNQINDERKVYDFAFIGLGASNSLLLISLIQKGLLKNKLIIIFEGSSKSENDKTYCFWASDEEAIVNDLSQIISYRFDNIKINNDEIKNIQNVPYHYIRSIDLYSYTLDILNEENIQVVREDIQDLELDGDYNCISTKEDRYTSAYVFDSRPPKLNKLVDNHIFLKQTFHGFHIKCEGAHFDPKVFEMMNFNVDQGDFTQFMYIIPFSTTNALVEFTRFGAQPLEHDYALQILNTYILENFGSYEILHEEFGSIPMTTWTNAVHPSKSVLRTGTSANLIKPSTGYGFKNMYLFAEAVSKRIESDNLINFNKISLPAKRRFKFYDSLLLIILFFWPSKGKSIFSKLFSKVPVKTIFNFLDETSTLKEEIKIFAALPILPFLKALVLYSVRSIMFRYTLAFLFVLAYNIIYFLQPDYLPYFNYPILLIGFLVVGIPHGALDHIISKKNDKGLFRFIAQYLFLIIINFALWQIDTTLALVLFICYSSFHFGESEWIESDGKINSLKGKIHSFFIGLAVLVFILITHLDESKLIISHIIGLSLNISDFLILPISILTFGYLLIRTSKSHSNSTIGLLFLLLLGLMVPLFEAFWLYFIFQHSTNAWKHLKDKLSMSSIQLFSKALLYTSGAFVLFFILIWYSAYFKSIENFGALVFIFLSCISFPHFIIMHSFYKK
jgi:lycopene beta-cyclase